MQSELSCQSTCSYHSKLKLLDQVLIANNPVVKSALVSINHVAGTGRYNKCTC